MRVEFKNSVREFVGSEHDIIYCASELIRNYIRTYEMCVVLLGEINEAEFMEWFGDTLKYITYGTKIQSNINDYLCGFDSKLSLEKNIVCTHDIDVLHKSINYVPTHKIILELCDDGWEEGLKYIMRTKTKEKIVFTEKILRRTAKRGRLSILKYLYDNHNEILIGNTDDFLVGYRMLYSSVMHGKIECLRYLYEIVYGSTTILARELCILAAQRGFDDCLKYLYECGCNIDTDTLKEAIENDRYECVEFLLKHGCKMDNYMVNCAVNNGIRYIKLIHEEWYVNNIDKPVWYDTITSFSTKSLDKLKYVHELGYPINEKTCISSMIYKCDKCVIYSLENMGIISNYILKTAIMMNNVEYVKNVLKYISNCNESDFVTAIRNGNVEILDCLIKSLKYNENDLMKIGENAALNGRVECLKYLYENKCGITEKIYLNAVYGNSIKCMEYIVNNGINVDIKECIKIASSIEMIEYLTMTEKKLKKIHVE